MIIHFSEQQKHAHKYYWRGGAINSNDSNIRRLEMVPSYAWWQEQAESRLRVRRSNRERGSERVFVDEKDRDGPELTK